MPSVRPALSFPRSVSMFPSWVARQVRTSAAHPVTKNSRRIPLSLERCEDRLPPGQLLSFLIDPLAEVLGSTPVEPPGPSLGDDTLATAGHVGSFGGQVPGADLAPDFGV